VTPASRIAVLLSTRDRDRQTDRQTDRRDNGGSSERHIFGRQKSFHKLKVPRQCPIFLLVEVRLKEGKVLGSEEGKGLGSGVYCEQRKQMDFVVYVRNVDVNIQLLLE
jgi:hypothetical protein